MNNQYLKVSQLKFFVLLSMFCLAFGAKSQNILSVPFSNGFVGLNTGNNSAGTCYYTNSLGFTNLQFVQDSPSNVFVAQGNDIIGSVVFYDAAGTYRSIPGFVKWRAPSGTVTTMVFRPSSATATNVSTNGSNGSSTYALSSSNYIGLTFNNQTLSISPVPGSVSGNAATSGLLQALNNYLGTFISASITDLSINEAAGSAVVTVSLSASSSSSISMSYTTVNGTATSGTDYTSTSGTLSFSAGVTSQTISIPISNDSDIEGPETFELLLSNPVNVSISNGSGTITIVDNDGGLTLSSSGGTEACDDYVEFLISGAANTYLTLELQNGTAIGGGQDFGSTSASNLQVYNGTSWVNYSSYVVIPAAGYLMVRTPLIDDATNESVETFQLKATPVSSTIASFPIYDVNFQTINLSGWSLLSGTDEQVNAVYRKTNAITIAGQAIDVRATITARSNVGTSAANFVFDNDGSNSSRFQPEINSTTSSGSYVDFSFKFYLSGTNTQVALENFYVTGVDVDGSSSSATEFIELNGLSSYTVDNACQLTITPNFRPGFTRFYGIPSGLASITFENTASFVANYFDAVSTLEMRAGYSSNVSSARLFSIAFGSSIGSFSTPAETQDSEIVTGTASITNRPTEICNNIDDDCDGSIDEGIATTNYYIDADADGYGDSDVYSSCSNPGSDYVLISGDCDNNNSAVYPGATEICGNGIDDDCVGGDEVCSIPGCTDPTACNYNASATDNNGTCTYPAQTYLNCAGNCINDTDNDGICNEIEVPGCTDPTACNYNALATDENASCTYPAQTYLNCAGNCINDTDNDGVCNELEVPGCTDPTACNYNALATDNNGTCTYPSQTYLNCAGNCINDTDNDGVCNELEIPGCTDLAACNYEELATDDNGSCILPINEICNGLDDNCDGEVDEYVTLTYYADNDGDGFGDLNTSMEACTLPNGYADNSEDCDDAIVLYEDLDGDGLGTGIWAACGVVVNGDCDDNNSNIYLGAQEICGNGIDEDCNGQDEICVIPGCTDPTACNYNASANQEDGTCTYPAQTYLTCEGTCINDTDGDGVCNEIEVPGCMDPTACNYNDSATDDNGSCSYASLTYYVDGDGDGFGAGDGALYCSNPGEGFTMDNTDCDDANAAINTSAVEVCNLIDDDCDGEIDEYVTTTYYADLDGDGFGDLNNAIESCTLPEGYSENSDDCDDAMLTYLDADGDGNGSTTADACGVGSNDDCDDSSNSVNANATEICGNGIDENCDGLDDVCIVNGCMDALACNYNASANQEDGTCTYPTQTYLNCDGSCINDTDGDGVCNELEVPGCTDPTACNYNAAATEENASCTYPTQTYLNCAGTCINDTDNDGVCYELEIPGCTDPSACNYDENATDEDASCTYPTVAYLNCSGECINDSDNDGICNEEEVAGCTDETACNFNSAATDNDGSCIYASLTYYVDGDGDGFGSGDGAVYCTDPGEGFTMDNSDCDDSNALISPSAIEVCNGVDDDCDIEVDEFVTNTYYADADGDGFGNATETIEACELPDGYTNNQEDCDDGLITFQDLDGDGMGSIILDACGSVSNEDCDDTNDGIFLGAEEFCGNGIDEDCDGQDLTCPIQGCMDTLACNYNPLAEIDNATCTYPATSSVGCNGLCIADTDGDGVCDPDEVLGCTHPDACNYNALATEEDESCTYPAQTYLNCDGTCINDTDADGVCNEIEVIGCQEETACNYNALATDDATCNYATLPYFVDQDGDGFGVGDAILFCEVPGEGYADHPGDCDDNNAAIYAGAIEVCNDVDDDCDGEVDENVLLTFYADADNDGFGDNNTSVQGCVAPEGYVNNDDDCDDTQVTYTDLDGDGYGSEGWVGCGSYFNTDCDDGNAGINPLQTDVCGNGIDEDCSGSDAICPLIVATDNSYVLNEDESNVILDVLGNDQGTATTILPTTLDLDVNTPGIQSSTNTSAGSWVVNASGQIVFTPNPNYNSELFGDAILTYQVSDANGVVSNVATVVVEITPVEDSPIIVEEVIDSLTPFQTPVEICLNAQEVDGQDNFIINVFGPNNGTIVGLEDTNYCFTYVPDSSFSGLDSIAIMMCDSGEGSVCDTVWINIQVGLGAPIAHHDFGTIVEDEVATINLLTNDDAGDLVIDLASVDLDPNTEGIQQNLTTVDGQWSVNAIGELTFTPNLNFNGNAVIMYTVSDTTGSVSNAAVVSINVLPANDEPVINASNEIINEETSFENSVVICIEAADVDGDNLLMSAIAGPSNGMLNQMDDGDLCFEYVPNNGFTGLDSIQIVICDNGLPTLCDTVYVLINVVPSAPVAADDLANVDEDSSVDIAILENDITNGSALDLNGIDLDPNTPGIQTNITTAEGVWGVDGLGVVTFTPVANFNGNASLNYNVSDVLGNVSNNASISVTVNPINDAPQGPSSVTESTPFETPATVCIDPSLVIDIDGDAVSVTGVVVDPSNGVVSGLNDGDLCFTYVPNANFTGVDSMLVTICDNGTPSLCDTVWAYVLIGGSSPVAVDDYLNSNNGTVSIDVVLNDQIPGNVGYTVSVADSTQNGTIVINGSLVSYTPNFGFCGVDSMSYSICNDMGMCDTAMLIIDVTPADADLDGISDYYETLDADVDADGVPNYLDEDSDKDGVSDAEEAGTSSLCDANFKDCDQDGTPDYLDFFTCGVSLEIPEGFSPNGDNTNDTWVIPGVEEFPENTMTVFNRWGARVYTKAPYDNSWDGTSSENTIGSNLLPEGTYFFVFTTGPNGETKNGYVYIKR